MHIQPTAILFGKKRKKPAYPSHTTTHKGIASQVRALELLLSVGGQNVPSLPTGSESNLTINSEADFEKALQTYNQSCVRRSKERKGTWERNKGSEAQFLRALQGTQTKLLTVQAPNLRAAAESLLSRDEGVPPNAIRYGILPPFFVQGVKAFLHTLGAQKVLLNAPNGNHYHRTTLGLCPEQPYFVTVVWDDREATKKNSFSPYRSAWDAIALGGSNLLPMMLKQPKPNVEIPYKTTTVYSIHAKNVAAVSDSGGYVALKLPVQQTRGGVSSSSLPPNNDRLTFQGPFFRNFLRLHEVARLPEGNTSNNGRIIPTVVVKPYDGTTYTVNMTRPTRKDGPDPRSSGAEKMNYNEVLQAFRALVNTAYLR